MLFRNRQVFFRIGRFEVFAEGWKRHKGEKLISSNRVDTGVSTDVQLWGPGVHLIVSHLR